MNNSSLGAWLYFWPLHLILILLAVVFAYGHTLDVPFYLDDFSSIYENTRIRETDNLFATLWGYAPLRIVGYLSIALNYQLDRYDVFGYHIFNIAIHVFVGCAVFGLTRGLLKTPAVTDKITPFALTWLPLLVALLFVLHPVHIQGVTYIVQRLASMAALFYILAMACYLQARLATSKRLFFTWFGACGLFAVLALFTKQNTFTLPLAILMLEIIFFQLAIKRLMQFGGIVLGGFLLLWLIVTQGFGYHPLSLESMQALTRETTAISRNDYLATQMVVLWYYIKLFFWPTGLHIDYEFWPLTGFLNVGVILGMLAHLTVIGGAIFLIRRLPLIAFGVLFYYLAHLIESSVIPITDVIFEHRTYLPNVGLCLVVGWVCLDRLPVWLRVDKVAIVVAIVALITVLGAATWQRNQIWRDPVALWKDNAEKAPGKARAHSILGKHLIQQGRTAEGVLSLQRAVQLQGVQGGVNINDVINIIVGLKRLKRYDEALAITQRVLQNRVTPFMRSKLLVNRGNIFFEQGKFKSAEQSYRQAIKAYPASLPARQNLASILGNRGDFDEAEQLYHEVLEIDPDHQAAQRNLQSLQLMRQGMLKPGQASVPPSPTKPQ